MNDAKPLGQAAREAEKVAPLPDEALPVEAVAAAANAIGPIGPSRASELLVARAALEAGAPFIRRAAMEHYAGELAKANKRVIICEAVLRAVHETEMREGRDIDAAFASLQGKPTIVESARAVVNGGKLVERGDMGTIVEVDLTLMARLIEALVEE